MKNNVRVEVRLIWDNPVEETLADKVSYEFATITQDEYEFMDSIAQAVYAKFEEEEEKTDIVYVCNMSVSKYLKEIGG